MIYSTAYRVRLVGYAKKSFDWGPSPLGPKKCERLCPFALSEQRMSQQLGGGYATLTASTMNSDFFQLDHPSGQRKQTYIS
jgi:hypothetical protein